MEYGTWISSSAGVLPTIALDYVIAIYPFILMLISYLLIVVYDRSRIVAVMCRPCRILFSLFRKNWDMKTSVIDSNATFFALSYVKIVSVTFELLVQVKIMNSTQTTPWDSIMHAGDIEYLGSEHHPYAILAIIMSIVFVILPVILLALSIYALSGTSCTLSWIPFKVATRMEQNRAHETVNGLQLITFHILLSLCCHADFCILLPGSHHPFHPHPPHHKYTTIQVFSSSILQNQLHISSSPCNVLVHGIDITAIKVQQLVKYFYFLSAIIGFIPLLYTFLMIVYVRTESSGLSSLAGSRLGEEGIL